MLEYHRYTPFPDEDFLVICSGHKALVIIDECDCINRPHVFFILMHNFSCIGIPLDYFLILAACHHYILLILIRVE